jgi:hypothetical protein
MKKSVITTCISRAGQQGKSILSYHLLQPMLGLGYAPIETFNEGVADAKIVYTGKNFVELAEKMRRPEARLAIDVGASNFLSVLEQLETLGRVTRGIDYFILPCTPTLTAQINTRNTVDDLMKIGVPAGKIIVIFNMVTDIKGFEENFLSVFNLRRLGVHVVDVPVLKNDAVFSFMHAINRKRSMENQLPLTVLDMAANPPDFTSLWKIWKEDGEDESIAEDICKREVQQDLLEGCARNLSAVFYASPLAELLESEVSDNASA